MAVKGTSKPVVVDAGVLLRIAVHSCHNDQKHRRCYSTVHTSGTPHFLKLKRHIIQQHGHGVTVWATLQYMFAATLSPNDLFFHCIKDPASKHSNCLILTNLTGWHSNLEWNEKET
jgi:hypothetical protein